MLTTVPWCVPASWLYLTQAGTEIGVASTKAFTTQLAALSEPNPVPRASSRAHALSENEVPAALEEMAALRRPF